MVMTGIMVWTEFSLELLKNPKLVKACSGIAVDLDYAADWHHEHELYMSYTINFSRFGNNSAASQ